MQLGQLGLVAVGGAAGALLRQAIGSAIRARYGVAFPWATGVINCSGCLLLGFVAALVERKAAPGSVVVPLVSVGFIGAYTTFSTFEYETLQLGMSWRALANLCGSAVVGYICVWAGDRMGSMVHHALKLRPHI